MKRASSILILACAVSACTATALPRSSENATGDRERGMRACPAACHETKTTTRPIEGGIELTIVSAHEGSEREIRTRARLQAKHTGATQKVEHTGEGTGTGRIGYCPVIHPGTRVTVEDVPGGVRVVLIARDPGDTERLREVVAERLEATAEDCPK